MDTKQLHASNSYCRSVHGIWHRDVHKEEASAPLATNYVVQRLCCVLAVNYRSSRDCRSPHMHQLPEIKDQDTSKNRDLAIVRSLRIGAVHK